MSHEINPQSFQGHQRGSEMRVGVSAGVRSTQRGLLTSRQPAAYFPGEDFQNTRIITEPTISSPSKKVPPVTMIRLARTEGTPVAAVQSLGSGLLFADRSGAFLTLKELAREADAARRER